MCKIKINIVLHRTLVCCVVGLQTILVGSIDKEHPSGSKISIGADTLDFCLKGRNLPGMRSGERKFLSSKDQIYFLGIYPC